MVTRYVGQPIRRTEDLRLITGAGRYTDDIGGGDRALEAAFVRSPHAHARILDIDVTDALDVDGIVAIYTYEDLEGQAAQPLPVLIPHPSLHAPRTAYPLANGVVQPRRRADRHGRGREPLPGRGCRRSDPGRVRDPAPGGGH